MVDRDMVLKGLECCCAMSGAGCRKCPYNEECMDVTASGVAHLAADALKLLKEQPEIVRCKDCKHIERINGINGCGYRCELWEYSSVLKDGFCNYGERKENCNG